MSSISCNNLEGEILEEYSCSGALVCCDRERILETCAEQEGEICSSGETCRGGTTVDASDLGIGESCCLVGSCEEVQEISDCELSGGVCRLYQCDENEEESFEDCEISSEVCCVKETRVQRSYVGIIVFGVLIVLVILGIVFREKLRPLWLKLKSKFGKGKGKPGPGVGPGMPPRFPPPGMGRIPPGRPIPGRPGFPGPRRMPVRRPPARPSGGELSDVLKKLKEMGK